ncbi:MAG: hypothetical protein K0R03_2666 [Moraxellaceae bacterium]|nr:hypothetical protein [Moraxellaceae bacterium]
MTRRRDVEKQYTNAEFVAKLRRLADAIELGERFDIPVPSSRSSTNARPRKRKSNSRSNGSGERTDAVDRAAECRRCCPAWVDKSGRRAESRENGRTMPKAAPRSAARRGRLQQRRECLVP